METIVFAIVLLAILGLIGAVVLLIASRVFKVEEDTRLAYLASLLPGINCGSCGFPGCASYAKAMLAGESTGLCSPGGQHLAENLSEFLGRKPEKVVSKKAVVLCQGSRDHLDYNVEYEGTRSCRIFNTMFFSSTSCPYGCIGFGDCADACTFGAIDVENGLATIVNDRCTGCEACLVMCPRSLIKMFANDPGSETATVSCLNIMAAKRTRKVCSIGCIGCGKCVKVCPQDAIVVTNNLANIDPDKCDGCLSCVEVCPTDSITITRY